MERPMARRVFFSFHYDQDGWRAGTVRNIGKLEADNPVSDNEWEQVKKGGDAAVKKWIDGQMFGKSCCVVLIGEHTASRRWVKYEIEQSWMAKRGVVGIRVHNLLDKNGKPSSSGPSPFNLIVGGTNLSQTVRLYDPPGGDSKAVYASISANIESWVEEAIRIRTNLVR
jgi:hypothetical protein